LKVKIPQGVMDGERIRLKGQGKPGHQGGTAGDLYLHIRVVPHPLFDVQGHNIIITIPLSPWEAALGTKISVPTLDGKIHLTIPPDSQSGDKLRVKGKGLKAKALVGDMFAVVKVTMPEKTSEKGKQLWQELANSEDFDPRLEWSTQS
jgi:curved DNA-binding protein